MKRRLIIAGAALAALLAAFAGGVGVGRSSKPAREEAKTQATSSAQAVAHEQEQRTEAPVRIVTRRVLVPCPPTPVAAAPATAVVEERTEERGPVVIVRTTDASSSTTASSTTSTVIIREQPRWLVGVDAEWQVAHLAPSSFSPTWGGQVMYRIAGPLWVGAGASLAGDVRARVALTF